MLEAIVLAEIVKKDLAREEFYVSRLIKHCCFESNGLSLKRADVEVALVFLETQGLVKKIRRLEFPNHVFLVAEPKAKEFLLKWGKELQSRGEQCQKIAEQFGVEE